MLVECCPYLDSVIPRPPAAVAPPSPSRPLPSPAASSGSEAVPSTEMAVVDQHDGGAGAATPAAAAPRENAHEAAGSAAAAPKISGGDAARTGDDRSGEDIGGSGSGSGGGGSTVTVLSQKGRRGEDFPEPLGDVALAAAAAAAAAPVAVPSSPTRKKPKIAGDGFAVDPRGVAL